MVAYTDPPLGRLASPKTARGRAVMATLEALAEAALRRDGLRLRSLAQDFLREHPRFDDVPRPTIPDATTLSAAAGLLELLGERNGRAVPEWTRSVGPAPAPVYLVAAAERMERLRVLCESESPRPLRKRGLYAPPDFLSFA